MVCKEAKPIITPKPLRKAQERLLLWHSPRMLKPCPGFALNVKRFSCDAGRFVGLDKHRKIIKNPSALLVNLKGDCRQGKQRIFLWV
jgi:hypothetical protein